ncbi:hypothetical protein [Leisingera sp.]|uniref:hypothetical protein n=1 Tax=Leisingera sp. TaxID=1879318 RepID=UPI002B265FCD|nr:hypothetical protein [Leisingera sp.]
MSGNAYVQAKEIAHETFSRLAELRANQQDLKRAGSRLKMCASVVDPEVQHALFEAAAIAYRRCFTTGVRQPLQVSDVEALGESESSLHLYFHNVASKFVAHSVNPFEDYKCGAAFLDDGSIVVANLTARLVSFSRDEVEAVIILIDQINEQVVVPRCKELEALAHSIAAELTQEERDALPALRIYGRGPESAGQSRLKSKS